MSALCKSQAFWNHFTFHAQQRQKSDPHIHIRIYLFISLHHTSPNKIRIKQKWMLGTGQRSTRTRQNQHHIIELFQFVADYCCLRSAKCTQIHSFSPRHNRAMFTITTYSAWQCDRYCVLFIFLSRMLVRSTMSTTYNDDSRFIFIFSVNQIHKYDTTFVFTLLIFVCFYLSSLLFCFFCVCFCYLRFFQIR